MLLLLVKSLLAALALNLLAPITARCRRRVEEYESARGRSLPSGDGPPREATRPRPRAANAEPLLRRRTIGFYVRQLIEEDGVLGVVFVPVLAAFIVLNTSVLAEAFTVLLDRAGVALGSILVAGVRVEITDLHLFGLALSAATMLLGSAYAAARDARSRWRWFVLLAGVVPIAAAEIWLSGVRGYLLAAEGRAHPGVPPLALAGYNALIGAVCAVTDTVGGYFVLHRLLVPLGQGAATAIVAPFEWLAGGLRRVRCPNRLREWLERSGDADRPGLAVYAGSVVDTALMDPLRMLDQLAVKVIFRRRVAPEVTHV